MAKFNHIFDIKQDYHDKAILRVYEHIPKEDIRGIYIAGSIVFNYAESAPEPNDIDFIVVVDDFSDTTLFGYGPWIADELTEIYGMEVDFFIQGLTIFEYLVNQPEMLPYYGPIEIHQVFVGGEGNIKNYTENVNRSFSEQKALARQHQARNRHLYNGTGVL